MTEENLQLENPQTTEPEQAEMPLETSESLAAQGRQIQAIEVPEGGAAICLILTKEGVVQLHTHGNFPKITALGALELAKSNVIQGA